MNEERRAFRAKIEAGLEALDEKMEALRTQAAEAKDEAREELEERLSSLSRKRATVGERLRNLKGATEDSWQDVKKGVENAWDELEQASGDLGKGFRKAVARFKDDGEKPA